MDRIQYNHKEEYGGNSKHNWIPGCVRLAATDLKTAYEVLCRGCEIRDRLELECVVCVFNQAFYAKAMEVFWKQKAFFKGLVIMMGGFHVLMMILGVIGTRFGDAGLKELAVQSEVIAEGSVEKVLAGKQYNRALRLHKIAYEAVMRLLVDAFETSLDDTESEILRDEKKEVEKMKTNFCRTSMKEFLVAKNIQSGLSVSRNMLLN